MVTPVGASLGLVPFVKTYYREMLQQHVRLKQQLIVQLQNQKAKQRKKKNAKGKKWTAKKWTHEQQVQYRMQQTRERSLKRAQDYALAMGTGVSSFYSQVAVAHSPALAMRRFWEKLVGASPMASPERELSLRLQSVGKTGEGRRETEEHSKKDNKKEREVFKSKYAGKDYQSMTETDSLVRYVALAGVAGFCRFWSRVLMRSCEVQGESIIHDAILRRDRDRALITVSNHTASIDDPFVTSLLVPEEALQPFPRSFGKEDENQKQTEEKRDIRSGSSASGDAVHSNRVRWVMCATDRCFKSKLESSFFKAVQVLPVERGAGLHQESMKVATRLLSRGGWVHIFPEGTRSKTGKLLPMKPGVGQLVVNTINEQADHHHHETSKQEQEQGQISTSRSVGKSPLIVPYYHEGMGDLMPKGKFFPRVGTDVKVVVGQAIEIEDLVRQHAAGRMTDKELRMHVVKRVEIALHQLQRKSSQEDYPLTYNNDNSLATSSGCLHIDVESSRRHLGRHTDGSAMDSGFSLKHVIGGSSLDLESISFMALNMWSNLHPLPARALFHETNQHKPNANANVSEPTWWTRCKAL
jgi:1-acyl-sn-glycerol-3-phosphate acyltransferase